MRHYEYTNQPSCFRKKSANLVGANLVARDRLLRISEHMKDLGFADTLADFAYRFLGLTKFELDEFLSGHIRCFSPVTIDRLKRKLDIAHRTVEGEIENAVDKHMLWTARSRYNLVQHAQRRFSEFIEKLD